MTERFGSIAGIRPNIKKVLNQRRLTRHVTDYSLGSKIEDLGVGIPTQSETSTALEAPALGADLLIVNRGLAPGSVLVTGAWIENTDYTILYEASQTSLHNIAIPPGTDLDIIYIQSDGDGATVEAAIAATLQNGWVAFGAPFATPAYYRDRQRCYLLGMIKDGTITAGTVLFGVDAGYEPVSALRALTAGSNAGVSIDVLANGYVVLGESAFEVGTQWLSLDGISWRVAS